MRRGPGPARYSREQLAKAGEDHWLTTAEKAMVIEAVDKVQPDLIPDEHTAAMCRYALMASGSSESSVSVVTHSWADMRRRDAAAQYCQATGADRHALARELKLGWIPLRPRPTF